jgi:hypothetical protein
MAKKAAEYEYSLTDAEPSRRVFIVMVCIPWELELISCVKPDDVITSGLDVVVVKPAGVSSLKEISFKIRVATEPLLE